MKTKTLRERLKEQFKDVWDKHSRDPDLVEDFEDFILKEIEAARREG